MLAIGDDNVLNSMIGNEQVASLYLGSDLVWSSNPPDPPVEKHGTISYFWYDNDMHLLAMEYNGSTERDTDYTWSPAFGELDIPTPPNNETVEWASSQ